MSRGVRSARNVLVGMGAFTLIAGLLMLITAPVKWQDWLTQFAVTALCWGLVVWVNRDASRGHNKPFIQFPKNNPPDHKQVK